MAKRTFAIVAVFAALLSVTLSVQAQNADEYYWTGARNNTYYFAGNWNVNGAAYDPDPQLNTITQQSDKYLDSLTSPSFEKVCHILTTSGTVNIDFSNLGVASLTIGNGQGGNTGTASTQRNSGNGLIVTNQTVLTINKGGTLTATSSTPFSVSGVVNVNGGAINAQGSTTVNNGGSVTVESGTFTASGSTTVNSGGSMTVNGGTLAANSITNNGTFTHSGGTLTSTGNFTNAGAFTQTGGTLTTTSTFTMTDGMFTQSAGSFSVADLTLSGGTMSATTINLNSGSGTFTQSGGTLSSYGNDLTITGSYVNSGGQIAYNGTIDVSQSVTLTELSTTFDLSSFIATPNQKITLVKSTNDSITITSGYDPDNPPVYNNWKYHLEDNGTKLTATYNGGTGMYYWSGGTEGDNLYSTTNNWSNDPHFDSYSPENNCYILSTSGTVNIDRSDLGVTSLTVGSGSTTKSAAIESNALEVKTALTIKKGGTATFNGALSITEYNSTPGTLTVDGGTVTANSTTGVSGNLIVNDGSFNAVGVVTVNNGGGLTVNGGTVNAQNTTGVAGTLTVTSGTYNSTGANTISAGGTLTVNGGTFETNSSTVISGTTGTPGNPGNLNVSSGVFSSSNSVTVNSGGQILVTGGTYNAHDTTVNSGGTFTYQNNVWTKTVTLNGGTFSYGNSGDIKNNGTITYSSGTLTLNGSTFRIGDRGHGTLNIEGGTLTINKYVYLGVGSSNEAQTSGTINQTSGNVTFTTRLYLGWGDWSGTYNLSGNGILTTEGEVGLWNGNSKGVSTFNMTGGTANFKNSGESFTIGLGGTNTLANVFNLSSGTINADNTFAVKYGGKLNVGQSGAGDGVLNAKTILINNAGILNLSSGTINLGSGITNNSGAYTINLSGGTFGNKAGDTGNGWSTSLTANIANGTIVTFAPAADKTITWNGALTGSGGGLTVDGEGTLELTAANTYSGVTTISAGTLKLSGSGTLAGNIVDNGTLEFAHTADLTGDNALTNAISGTGKVTKTGSGTLELKGANTYSGGTTISAGTLKLSNNNLPGTGNVTLENNGILEFANNDGLTFSKVISGTGSVTKSGSGVLHVSGANTYSGGTKISGEAIRLIDNNATLGTGTINLTPGDLRFSGEVTSMTVTNTITGSGNITKQGTSGGVVTFTGDLSGFTGILTTNGASDQRGCTIKLTGENSNLKNASAVVNNGTLDVSDYSGSTTMQLNKLSGAGIVNIGSKAIILNNAASADSTTFSGVINGTGAVTKTGLGTLTLTQAPAYTGSTTIEAGTLELPGNSTLHNLSGGTLGDNGQIAVQANLVVDGKLTLDNNAMSKFIGSITATEIEKTGNGTLKLYSAAANMISAESLVISSGRVDIKEYFKGQIEVKSGGTISPGNSVGTLEIVPLGEETYGGGFILNEEGSKLLMEIGGETPDKNDKLIVDGPLSIGSGIIYLALADENTLTTGDSFEAQIIAGNESTDYLNAITKAVVPGWPFANVTVTKSGNVYSIRGIYDPNAVPEPSTWALLILGAAGMLYWRKRKSNK